MQFVLASDIISIWHQIVVIRDGVKLRRYEDGTNVFVDPAKGDRKTDQEAARGKWLHREGRAERYGL